MVEMSGNAVFSLSRIFVDRIDQFLDRVEHVAQERMDELAEVQLDVVKPDRGHGRGEQDRLN